LVAERTCPQYWEMQDNGILKIFKEILKNCLKGFRRLLKTAVVPNRKKSSGNNAVRIELNSSNNNNNDDDDDDDDTMKTKKKTKERKRAIEREREREMGKRREKERIEEKESK